MPELEGWWSGNACETDMSSEIGGSDYISDKW